MSACHLGSTGASLSDEQHTILRLQRIGMRYGEADECLRDIDLTIKAGSFQFLTGPSGAGKTSLLRLISLSHPPSRGQITLFGRDIGRTDKTEVAALRRRIGVIFQDFRLLEHLSAFDNVALPLRIGGVEDEKITSFVSEMMAWLDLSDLIEAKPAKLSMGQRQLISVARAVVTRPRLLLADEPTSNIDEAREQRLMHLFEQLHKLGTSIIFATHNRALLSSAEHPVLRMTGGQLTVASEPASATSRVTPGPGLRPMRRVKPKVVKKSDVSGDG